MNTLFKFTVILMILTALVVWFVPGLDLWVETLFQQILGRAARST